MADPKGFLNVARADAPRRAIPDRLGDWRDVYEEEEWKARSRDVSEQARRCMDCGIPFCHSGSAGCPLGNLIPEWNDLVRRGRWDAAAERLHATNNFPEFTGHICPAPCEPACVLSISEKDTGGAVAIKRVELAIADAAWAAGSVVPQPPTVSSGRSIAVVGSGPAGLAAAQQLTRAGHDVTVYERDDRVGGLLRYGIPEYKLEKRVLDQRLMQMRAEGTRFITECDVGVQLPVRKLQDQYDAIILAVGALQGRDNEVPGRELTGVHLAMEHLVPANRECEGDGPTTLSAADKHVVIIGGGDTAADCYGTALRQGAKSVTQLDVYPEPPRERDPGKTPWPMWPLILRNYPVHDEGGTRTFAVAVERFVGDDNGHVSEVELVNVRARKNKDGRRIVTPISDPFTIPCGLALLAIGFDGVGDLPVVSGLGLSLNKRGTISCGPDWKTTAPGVFVCGDAHRGASLVVWAIAEGRSVAHAVDAYLTGHSDLPAPVHPTALPLAL
ncbi:glutamate synthase subunit beta [Hoyosella altamirensis]|uniref:Glutamate synthase (NADPH/NADH) small chain n=1 Tax=Hoyosella altamirensis TaxID=616997 RepID=A0A839RQS1_9ACTN|nr:glutamate synthase subunit beta [Hoyosella altamirensis]MBB3038727.1 glutamate synthase (NADPH/NADH) small chain [Hoyosella altamirensis]